MTHCGMIQTAHTHVTSHALDTRLLAFSVNMAISFLSRIEFLATPSKQYSLSTAVESRLHELEQKVTFHGEAESSRRNQINKISTRTIARMVIKQSTRDTSRRWQEP